jgi:hypothetical protein
MISRRELLLAGGSLVLAPDRPRRVAAIVTVYHHNSHADMLVSRLLQSDTLDGLGRRSPLELAGLYVDQFPATDKSRSLAKTHGFRIYPTPQEALTLGTETLAVDGVLIIGEHGAYPTSDTGAELYPRKRFFDATTDVFRRATRSVPVFVDKHLSHDWSEAKEMYETARRLGFALMAGSSLPGTWRRPAVEIAPGARLEEIVSVSYHTLYGYGFHALEMTQCLAERRAGGETGVRRVQTLEGEAVWEAGRSGRYDRALLAEALGRLTRGVPADLEKKIPQPVAFLMDYRDGLRATVLTLNPAVGEWATGWRERGKREPKSTLFWTQEARPFYHFAFQFRGIEKMILTGKPAWPAERTLLTTGMMDFLLKSRREGSRPIDTPSLAIRYQPGPAWRKPSELPPDRPIDAQ